MSDQLSLELPAGMPALPSELRPMEPQLGSPFDSPNHLFQPLWGGLRVLAFVARSTPVAGGPVANGPVDGGPLPGIDSAASEARPAGAGPGGIVRLVDADGLDRSAAFPELAGLAERLTAASAVLDGELVVVDGFGRHDPSGLAARLAAERSSGRARLGSGSGRVRLDPGRVRSDSGRLGSGPTSLGSRPALFLAFDLLHLDGRSLLGNPLHRRRELLQRVVRPGGVVLVVPAVEGDGRVLHAAVTDERLAGVLARVRTSPYLPGVRSRLWRFIPSTPDSASPGEAPPAGPEAAGPDEAGTARRPTGPVLAVISRLPLDEP